MFSMFSRRTIQSLSVRTATLSYYTPNTLSSNTRCQFHIPSNTLLRTSIPRWPSRNQPSYPTRSYQQQRKPRKYYRYNPDDARHAKPLLSEESIGNFIKHPRLRIAAVIVVGGGIFFYISNLEDVPISNRRRFNVFSPEAMEGEGARMYKQILQEYNGAILPDWDDRTKMVKRVMSRLIPASGLEHAGWEVYVINSNEKNAFVIPGGKVFVFAGILPIAATDDGLAAILGHEIAHNVANHSGETMSKTMVFTTPLRWLFRLLDNLGYTAGFGEVFGSLILQFGLNLPASRNQESEADYIGLIMMAKSCYNPEAALGVWERMQAADQNGPPQWLSTHPSHGNRILQISGWVPKAKAARAESGCATTTDLFHDFQDTIGDLWGSFK